MKFILMCVTFVSHFTSKYFQTAIQLTPLMNESNLWSITLQVLEFAHQQIIYINATYLKLDVLPKGCVFLSILGHYLMDRVQKLMILQFQCIYGHCTKKIR